MRISKELVDHHSEEWAGPEGENLDLSVRIYNPTLTYSHELWVDRKIEIVTSSFMSNRAS